MEEVVVIIGAGPAGLASSACLNRLDIPNIILEREGCYASLWRKKAYDRVKLHLAKQFCELPYMSYPPKLPMFVPKNDFISYLDNYASHFGINPRFHCYVESVYYDKNASKWCIVVRNNKLNTTEVYIAKFLVVATGENSEGLIPKVPGLDGFEGMYMHSSQYANGKDFNGKDVLVVGCGNSGMEIAYDLLYWGAHTSIVARSPVHVISKEIVFLGMCFLKYLPCRLVDFIATTLSKIKFGDTSKYGIQRPTEGPFYIKAKTGRSPTIDVGAVQKIKTGEIQVYIQTLSNIEGTEITFENGKSKQYDAIIFATGYRSTVLDWLKDGKDLFNENGMPKLRFPNHWKGGNGLYCAGFSRSGLMGISLDAQQIATDIGLAWKGASK
ncbi:probable indole-3-pyruvate monooxygenase YUCCA11 isoform X1 [Populus trichocarpa]|uniref:probable indole-3-pyruvate monooxygenase YUCCA11 isoform X1 n=1 Tax=Populus trichocarpa TaxID=3694 RepID=UPI000D18A71D|nr:probable indole-3-pyruvate monooxygenase YUCCA11 isoform X1 [Populus trichocarpa]|eukprot:XP_024456442.1 probable indole-3-pyruvate monooxygenase YUCCA11 isoform X1 [Populus trichocarpa]